MHWTIEFDESHGYFLIVTSGDFNFTDHRKMVEDLLSQPEWRPATATLFDHRQLRFDDIGFSEVLEAKSVHVNNDAQIGNGKSAILMKSTADYGIGRQFQNVTDGRVLAQIRIFLDEAEAIAWLVDDVPETR